MTDAGCKRVEALDTKSSEAQQSRSRMTALYIQRVGELCTCRVYLYDMSDHDVDSPKMRIASVPSIMGNTYRKLYLYKTYRPK